MEQNGEKFNTWAIVELMGHRKIGGRVTEQIIAGAPLLRIDVPEVSGQPGFTQFYGPSSIYMATASRLRDGGTSAIRKTASICW